MKNLEHLAWPESKKVLKQKRKQKTHKNGSMSKGQGSQVKELPMAKVEQFEQQSKAVLDYNLK